MLGFERFDYEDDDENDSVAALERGSVRRAQLRSTTKTSTAPSPRPSPIRWERVADLSAVAEAKAEGRAFAAPKWLRPRRRVRVPFEPALVVLPSCGCVRSASRSRVDGPPEAGHLAPA
jgi:hypothetical protein